MLFRSDFSKIKLGESLLEAVSTRGRFAITDYLKLKAKVMLSLEDDSTSSGSSKALKEKKERKERKERTRSAEKVKVEVPTDILHPELYRALSEWRTASGGCRYNAAEQRCGDSL